jgi:hypothetical protein
MPGIGASTIGSVLAERILASAASRAEQPVAEQSDDRDIDVGAADEAAREFVENNRVMIERLVADLKKSGRL